MVHYHRAVYSLNDQRQKVFSFKNLVIPRFTSDSTYEQKMCCLTFDLRAKFDLQTKLFLCFCVEFSIFEHLWKGTCGAKPYFFNCLEAFLRELLKIESVSDLTYEQWVGTNCEVSLHIPYMYTYPARIVDCMGATILSLLSRHVIMIHVYIIMHINLNVRDQWAQW